MKKFFREIHLWLSIPFGLIITLTCFSGAMLVFESEIMELKCHDLYYVEQAGEEPLPMEKLLETVSATLPDSVTITGITVSDDPERAYQASLSQPRRSSIYIDQYTGEIKGRYERSLFFTNMFLLHRFLLDSMKPGSDGIFWGKLIVGISTLVFVVVLISGVVIWWPRTKEVLKKRLKINVGKGGRHFWHDLHIVGGMYVLLFLLAMALTGLTWSFSWYRTGFYKVFGAEVQQGGGHGAQAAAPASHGGGKEGQQRGSGERGGERHGRPDGEHRGRGRAFANWQKVVDTLKEQNPDFKQITVSAGSASVSFRHFGNQRASDRYTFNPRNGEITEAKLYKDSTLSDNLRGWIFSVHVGSWGGLLTKTLYFLAALLGATLPLTGYYLWIVRRWGPKKGKPEHKHD